MKALSTILIILILSLALCISFLFVANNGLINKPLKYAFEYYLNLQGFKSKITNFSCKNWVVSASEITLHMKGGQIKAKEINIDITAAGPLLNPLFKADILVEQISLRNKDNKEILQTRLKANYATLPRESKSETDITLANIQAGLYKALDDSYLPEGIANFHYTDISNKQNYVGNLTFGEGIYFNYAGKKGINSLKAHLGIKNFPLLFYQIAYEIAPKDKLFTFLNDYIKAGHIVNGIIDLELDNEFYRSGILREHNLKGNLQVSGLELSYEETFPSITNLDVDIILSGSLSKFLINKGYSTNTLISDGVVEMDWQGISNTIIHVKAKGYGPANDLTYFIPESSYNNLRKASIDLRKITGQANTLIEIEIPLKPEANNIYNIKTNIPKSSLNIFKDQIKLRHANIDGIFNGDQVILTGKGRINDFNSNLNFIYKITDELDFTHKLNIQTQIQPVPNIAEKQKIGFISLLGGSSVMDIEYIHKDNQGTITANADLKNLDLYFDKIGIHKQKGESGEFTLNGIFSDPTTGNIAINLAGANNLNMVGNINISENKIQIKLPRIKHKQTDLKADVIIENEIFDAKITGKILDLSNAEMINFLEKERDGSATKLKLDVDRVRLKDNIWLDDLKLKFDCNKTRCFAGYIDSQIGNRTIEMLLIAKGKHEEEWVIKCSNSGALLKAIGAYNFMKTGDMYLTINTRRKEVKAGSIIPVLDGTFTFKRFALHNTPAITKLVSFISIPGFVNMIRGNNDIIFSGMTGKFSFINNILTIEHSIAKGPYFGFTMHGNIDIENRTMDLKGHVNPSLYGVSSFLGWLPVVNKIFIGDKKHRGLMSAPYSIKDQY